MQSSSEGVSVSCGKCKGFISDGSKIFFYDQYVNGMHFCIKPEWTLFLLESIPDVNYFKCDQLNPADAASSETQGVAEDKMQIDSPEAEDEEETSKRRPLIMRLQPVMKRTNWAPYIFVCANCDERLGNICPIGPKNETVCCFSNGALHIVKSNGMAMGKGTWPTLRPFFGSSVECRDIVTFYGLTGMTAIEQFQSKPQMILKPTFDLIKQTSLKELTVFKPRPYQIECFVQASLQNSIVYLPTGAGKTLVASMLTALMNHLNPFKVVVFVVHRVSLAFQQAQYIKEQTGLEVLVACGETVEDMPRKLKLADHPVIVVTAQVLINWIKRQVFRLEDCSLLMMDEVHNAVKTHPFVIIMREFYSKVEPAYKPLFLGLTASPTTGQAVEMHMALQELCATCESKVYMPCLLWEDLMQTINRPKVTFSVVEITEEMTLMNTAIVELCKYLVRRVKVLLNIQTMLEFPFIDNLNGARGFIRALSDMAYQHGGTEAIQLTLLMSQVFSAVEIVSVLGPKHAKLYLSEVLNALIHKKESFMREEDIVASKAFLDRARLLESSSDKVNVLLDILLSCTEEEAVQSRVIIFVQTKRTARQLFQLLKGNEVVNSRWLPAIFVGQSQGQVDGMSYLEEQGPTLQRFRLGQHRLLLSTNVLQEGMDVPVCNRVILFDQSWSLTSFIQSRGRARAADSVYNLICSEKQKQMYEDLIKTERTMENTILRLMSIERRMTLKSTLLVLYKKHEVDALVHWVSRPDGANTLSEQSSIGAAAPVSTRRLKYIAIRFHNLPAAITAEMLETLLEELSLINMKFEHLEASQLFSNEGIIEMHGEIYSTVQFKLADFYKLFRDVLKACETDFYPILSYKLLNMPRPPCNDLYLVIADNMDVGNLLEPNKFVSSHSVTNPVKFGISFIQGVIRAFYLAEDKRCFRMDIPFPCVDKFVLVDLAKGSRVSVTIPLNRAPLLFYAHTEDRIDVKLSNMDRIAWERSSPLEFAEFVKVEESAAIRFDVFLKGMERDELLTVAQRLKGNGGIEEVCYGPVEVVQDHGCLSQSSIEEAISYFSEDFDLVYSLRALFTSCFSATCCRTPPKFFDILNMLPPHLRKAQIEQLALKCHEKRFVDLEVAMLEIIQEGAYSQVQKARSENTCPVRFVTVTPTRILYEQPKDMILNRILRSFSPDYFLRVHFRDEDGLRLSSVKCEASLKNLLLRVERFLQDGLFIGGRHFEFLAMSSSQLRDHGCWFVASHYAQDGTVVNADRIRAWCGDFTAIKNIAKYVARLGQSLSASQDTVVVPAYEFEMIDDITVTSPRAESGIPKKYTFTDGIGMISPALARKVSEKLGLSPMPSAFQIRFAGFKGVVAVNPMIAEDDPLKKMWLRDSMKKFESKHYVLEVLNTTKIIPCFLNRQVLLILSGLGVPDDAFIKLQDEMFDQMAGMLIDSKEALAFLSQNYYVLPQLPFLQMTSQLDATVEPFFRSLVFASYKRQLSELLTRSRIFLPRGRILMGTIDETGSLREGEVFVQCQRVPTDVGLEAEGHLVNEERGMFILNGQVTVAKNPCMHPGDVRKLQAVDVPALRRTHYDCVVFPAVGHRPITDMCSGSDLDGDLYFITWDRNLLPPDTVEPMEYDAPKATEVKSVSISDVQRFMVDFIANDQLGTIANAHVAHVDHSSKGVRSPLCVLLAYLFSMAVDFPKTGFIPEFPKEARVEAWPDFMQKAGQDSYASPKVIGRLFRKARSIFFSTSLSKQTEVQPDVSFLLPGWEAYAEEAKLLYKEYSDALALILGLYSVREEAQIFAGALSEAGTLKKDDLRTAIDVVKRKVGALHASYRKIVESKGTEDQYKMASACYAAAYGSPYRPAGLNAPVLSFAWICGDLLLARHQAKEHVKPMSHSIQYAIGKDLIEQTIKLLGEDHVSSYMERLQFSRLLESNLRTSLGSDQFELDLVGSSATGLFACFSDVNLVVRRLPPGVSFLQDLLPIVSEMFGVSVQDGQIHHRAKQPFAFVIADGTKSKEGLESAASCVRKVRSALTEEPLLLALIVPLQRWARAQNLVRRSTFHTGQLSSMQLTLALITFMEREGTFTSNNTTGSAEEEYSWLSGLVDWIRALGSNDKTAMLPEDSAARLAVLGKAFLDFVKFLAFAPEPILPALLPGLEEATGLREHFFKAFHLLSQSLSVQALWTAHWVSEEIEQEIALARRPKLYRRPGLSASAAVFMEGASVLLFEGARSDLDRLAFDLYQLRRRPQHQQAQCFVPVLRPEDAELCGARLYDDYFASAVRQFDLAKRTGNAAAHGILKLAIRFGRLYVTHLPRLFLEEGLSTNIENTRKALSLGYKTIPETRTKSLLSGTALNELSLDHPKEEEERQENFKEKHVPTPAELLKKRDEEQEETTAIKKAVVKKKTSLTPMTSSFEPHVHSDTGVRELISQLALRPDSEEPVVSGYVVALTLFNGTGNAGYQIMYDKEMTFFKMSERPIRWMSIDVKALDPEQHLDLRLALTSRRELELPEETEDAESMLARLKQPQSILRFEAEPTEGRLGGKLQVRPEFLANERLFVRGSHQERFIPSPATLSVLRTRCPALFSSKSSDLISELLSRLVLRITWVSEWTEHDPTTGLYPHGPSEKIEVEADFKIGWEELETPGQVQAYVHAAYHLAQLIKPYLQ